MKIDLLLTGKTDRDYLVKGISIYETRLKRYCSFNIIIIPALKSTSSMSEDIIRDKEGEAILRSVDSGDLLILLDERGDAITSEGFASRLENWGLRGVRRILFVVGGAYGFGSKVYERSNGMISLSPMTFSHQMVRLIFAEQLYRAFTIIKGEPYHHK